ncbi:MAG: hypothetical protein H7Z16_06915 [Pyrinomonadaceae bacterium]|nr:hypothetical protein [Pyrinomonadaceae bacterium]
MLIVPVLALVRNGKMCAAVAFLPMPPGAHPADLNIPPVVGVILLGVVLLIALLYSLSGAAEFKVGTAYGFASAVAMVLLMIFSANPPSPLPLTWLFLIGVSLSFWSIKAFATHFGYRRVKAIAGSWGILLATFIVASILVGNDLGRKLLVNIHSALHGVLLVLMAVFLLALFLAVLTMPIWGIWGTMIREDKETDERRFEILSMVILVWLAAMAFVSWIVIGLKAILS